MFQGEDLEYLAESNVMILSEELVIQNITHHQATPSQSSAAKPLRTYRAGINSIICIVIIPAFKTGKLQPLPVPIPLDTHHSRILRYKAMHLTE